MKKKVLFLAYGGGHVNTLIPIVSKVIAEKKFDYTCIGINLAAEAFKKADIPCKTLSDYADSEIMRKGMPYADQFHDFSSVVSYVDSSAYYGFSVRDLEKEVGEEFAEEIFKVYDRRLFLPVDAMKEILKKEKPDLVVVTTMHRFEAATVIAANELGILSLRVEDLLGKVNRPFPDKILVQNEEEKQEYIKNGVSAKKIVLSSELKNDHLEEFADEIFSIYLNLQATKFAVFSEYTKENLMKRDIPEEKIEITGQPAFDQLKDYMSSDKKLKQELGIPENSHVLVYLSQPLLEMPKVFESIVKAVSALENVHLVVKLHPNEDGKVQSQILEAYEIPASIVKSHKAPEVINIADIAMTISSTTGIESALMDKPVIYFNYTDEEDFIPFDKMGIGVRIGNEDESKQQEQLIEKIGQLLVESDLSQKLVEGRAQMIQKENASDNIAALIQQMLGE